MNQRAQSNHDVSALEIYQALAATPQIFEAIAEAQGLDPLRIQTRLREEFPSELVPLALTVAELRGKAASRHFPHADQMWFDRVRLEQATAWPVALHKAVRFQGLVHDLCCGLGADALALARRGPVVAVDSDPLACWFTQENATVHRVADQIRVERATAESYSDRTGLLHLDPDRRTGATGRAVRVEDYVPNLETMHRFMAEFPGGAIKLSPASNFGGKFDDVEVELISLAGECKEATIWFGSLRGPYPWRATALPSGETIAGDPLSAEPQLDALGEYLFDPDPALVRAGLVDLFCEQQKISRLDLAEEYLTSNALVESPFVRPFRVLQELPNNERDLRNALRDLDAGILEIKARRLPVPVERLQKRLPHGGSRPLVVFYCRIAGRSRIVIAERPLS